VTRDIVGGMTWAFEPPEEHWADHDTRQLRYWLTRPAAERLAQAAEYRRRLHGDVVAPAAWRWRFLGVDEQ
jgi:hypothetical protein